MDAFILSLLAFIVFLGCMGLKHESQKRQMLNWTERYSSAYELDTPHKK